MNAKELLKLKERIDTAKIEVSELEGRKKALLEELDREYGCKSVKQAEKKRQQMEEEQESLKVSRLEAIAELEENYEF